MMGSDMSQKQSLGLGALLILLGAAAYPKSQSAGAPVAIDPGKLRRVGAVDERYQSYNVEMAEVTGGNFWKPYGKQGHTAAKEPPAVPPSSSTPAGMNPDLYQY